MNNEPCKTCGSTLNSITENIPVNLVQIGGLYVGKEVRIQGKHYRNRIWIENFNGEGCFVPLPKIEKLIAEEFNKGMG